MKPILEMLFVVVIGDRCMTKVVANYLGGYIGEITCVVCKNLDHVIDNRMGAFVTV